MLNNQMVYTSGIGKCPILGLLDITFEWQL